MYKIYVGTTNQVKLDAVKKVVGEAEVIGIESDSKVGAQPKSDEATITGAYNRAQSLPKDGLRIGLEAGVHETNHEMFLVNWGVLIDLNNQVYYAGGTRIVLPTPIANQIRTTQDELAHIMDAYFNTQDIKHKQGAIGILTHNRIHRIDIFTHIVSLLMGQLEAYQTHPKLKTIKKES